MDNDMEQVAKLIAYVWAQKPRTYDIAEYLERKGWTPLDTDDSVHYWPWTKEVKALQIPMVTAQSNYPNHIVDLMVTIAIHEGRSLLDVVTDIVI